MTMIGQSILPNKALQLTAKAAAELRRYASIIGVTKDF